MIAQGTASPVVHSDDPVLGSRRSREASASDPEQARADAAFEALLVRERTDLLRFAFWLAGDRCLAEEIVQEAMLRAWNARRALKQNGSLRSWLLTIVRREHARLYERKRLPMVPLDEAIEEAQHVFADDDDQDIRDLQCAILALPESYREPLLMQVILGYSTEQIARETGLTRSAVLTRLFRARNTLRELYAT